MMALDASWEGVQRILCVRLDAMGDVLMTTPAFTALKESTGAELTLLTSPGGSVVASYIPSISHLLVYDAPWVKSAAAGATGDSMIEFARKLHNFNFDAAVIFTVYSQSALPAAVMCHLAAIPLRLAYCRENPYQLLTHWVKEDEPTTVSRHETERQLHLVAQIGARTNSQQLVFNIPWETNVAVTDILERLGISPTDTLVIVHPGASAPSRRYGEEKFAEAINLLEEQREVLVIFTGNVTEINMITRIQSLLNKPTCSLAGRLDVAELAALLKRADVLLSNNTGPVHIAAAVGTPVVDLYALTNPQHTPWLVPHRVLFHDVECRFCYKSVCPMGHNGCLQWIAPGQIAEAVGQLIDERKSITVQQSIFSEEIESAIFVEPRLT